MAESDERELPKAAKTRLRAFFTSVPGFMAGLATVVTATVTIFSTLDSHGTTNPHAANAATPQMQTTALPATGTATGTTAAVATTGTAGGASPRIQWGPGSLEITNGGTDFSSVPPVSDAHGGDLYSGGSTLSGLWGAQLAVWTGPVAPTARQCSNLVSTQSTGGTVTVNPGTIVCAQTTSGLVAIMTVTSVNENSYSTDTETTVWDMPTP